MVCAKQHIRQMRGDTRSHLMLAEDDQYYVVKFSNNPQHRRVLINELVCYELLDYLGLPTPSWRVVEVPQTLIAADPDLCINRGEPCAAGLHFGSRYVVDPARQAVYDYLPAILRKDLVNRATFLGMLAFDKWINNTDCRQAAFHRGRASRWLLPDSKHSAAARSLVYGATFIDHGLAFNGGDWRFTDGPFQGLCADRTVYGDVQGIESFEPWLGKIESLHSGILESAYTKIPKGWYNNESDALERLLEQLYSRRRNTSSLLREARSADPSSFRNWTRLAFAATGRR
jgi:hypothetical protein